MPSWSGSALKKRGIPFVVAGNSNCRQSWLNAVETWFSQLERRSIYRNSFTSVQDLRQEIRRYMRVHNQHLAKPFKWRATADSILAKVKKNQRINRSMLTSGIYQTAH